MGEEKSSPIIFFIREEESIKRYMRVITTIDDNNIKRSYALTEKVILGNKAISEKEFKDTIKEILPQTETYSELQNMLVKASDTLRKASTTRAKGRGRKTIEHFFRDIKKISEPLVNFIRNLGGDQISLLTTFNFNNKEKIETYFLVDEKMLIGNKINQIGEKNINNTLAKIKQLEASQESLIQLDKIMKNHLWNFYKQVQDPKFQDIEAFKKMRVWSYYNMKKRYNEYKRDSFGTVSIAKYFWGDGYYHGYINESFGNHLVMQHAQVLSGKQTIGLRRSVIEEHGGPGETSLFLLLQSAKGNLDAHWGGDTILIDQEGNVVYNIQDKGSIGRSYNYIHNYTEYVQSLQALINFFLEITKRGIENIKDEEVEKIFKRFSATVLQEIEQELNEQIENESDALLANLVK